MEAELPRQFFGLGDWVRVPVTEIGNFHFVIGPVVYTNSRLFVMKSVVGGFTISFTWTEVAINPGSFRKVGIFEAYRLLEKRLYGRKLLV